MANLMMTREGWLSPPEFAKRYGIGINRPYVMIHTGELDGLYVKVCGRFYIRADAFERLAERQAQHNAAE